MKHSVAEKIRYRLEEQNLSVLGLEKKAGLKVHAVQNILSGHSKKPNIDTLLSIANGLGCSLSDLIDVPEPKGVASQTKIEKFTNLPLLEDVTIYLLADIKQSLQNITAQTLSETIQEIYIYCEKNKGGTLDKDFARWVLERLK